MTITFPIISLDSALPFQEQPIYHVSRPTQRNILDKAELQSLSESANSHLFGGQADALFLKINPFLFMPSLIYYK